MASTCPSSFWRHCLSCSRFGYDSIVSPLADCLPILAPGVLVKPQKRFDARLPLRPLFSLRTLQFAAEYKDEAGAGLGYSLNAGRKGRKPQVDIDGSRHTSLSSASASKVSTKLLSKHHLKVQARWHRERAADKANHDESQPFKAISREKPKVRRESVDESNATTGELTADSDQERSAHVTFDFADHRAMQLVFLGTSSSIPTWRRSTSCVALRLDGTIFLFDCGEGALRQILKTPMKHYDIDSIFITHMHGDHACKQSWGTWGALWMVSLNYGLSICQIFGLPSLKEFENKDPINIYGPQGLRQWIRSTLKASHARVYPKYAVHEIILKKKPSMGVHHWNLVEENHDDELSGRDIECSPDGLWDVYADEKYVVRAGFLRHTIPCWGYVVEEHTRRGRFNVDRAAEAGVKPGPYFRILESGNPVTLSNGKVVLASDVLGPPRRGRKVVILGDTCDSTPIEAAAREADVVVHEATVLKKDESEVYQRGHSTAHMAGKFARVTRAGTLVLTHFSRKLGGAQYVDEVPALLYMLGRTQERTTIRDLVSEAREAFRKNSVIAAEDFMAITVPLVDKPPIG